MNPVLANNLPTNNLTTVNHPRHSTLPAALKSQTPRIERRPPSGLCIERIMNGATNGRASGGSRQMSLRWTVGSPARCFRRMRSLPSGDTQVILLADVWHTLPVQAATDARSIFRALMSRSCSVVGTARLPVNAPRTDKRRGGAAVVDGTLMATTTLLKRNWPFE